jgi:hypothetical protein
MAGLPSSTGYYFKVVIPGLPALYSVFFSVLSYKRSFFIIIPFFAFWGLILWLNLTTLFWREWMVCALIISAAIWTLTAFLNDGFLKSNYHNPDAATAVLYFSFGFGSFAFSFFYYAFRKAEIIRFQDLRDRFGKGK